MTTWVLLLNSNDCRVFSFSKKNHTLELIKDIFHAENKGRNQDIVSDRPGHYVNDNAGGGSYSPHTSPKEIKIDQFVHEICHFVEDGRVHQKYEKLIIISAPRMQGYLEKHLNKNIEKLITQHIQKDIVFMKQHEVLDFLMQHE